VVIKKRTGATVQLSSVKEAEKRWRYSWLRVESPAVKRRLYVCCS
jgi:hypothetical protein